MTPYCCGTFVRRFINPLNAELNPIRHLLALVGARHIVRVSRMRVNWQPTVFLSRRDHISCTEDGVRTFSRNFGTPSQNRATSHFNTLKLVGLLFNVAASNLAVPATKCRTEDAQIRSSQRQVTVLFSRWPRPSVAHWTCFWAGTAVPFRGQSGWNVKLITYFYLTVVMNEWSYPSVPV